MRTETPALLASGTTTKPWSCVRTPPAKHRTMELKNDLTQLNNIHDLLADSHKGYMEAADKADHGAVKELLNSLASSRVQLLSEVVALSRQADPSKEPREAGTLKGDLHRAWMDIRESLGSHDSTNMLNECERGEKYLLDRYDTILKEDVTPQTRALATSQRATVQKNYDHVKQVRKTMEMVEK